MHSIRPIPCFLDNYIWFIACANGAWVVDPGAAEPVLAELRSSGLTLLGILITHHHADHTGGIAGILEQHDVPVYGPAEADAQISHATSINSTLDLPGLGSVQVLSVAAHTLDHIAYYLPADGAVFCGDSLFSAGCGRLFEGTPDDLAKSLATLDALPADTVIYPTHEYTQANLAFAHAVEPDNQDILQHQQQVALWRQQNTPSLPTNLALERRINPFLRSHEREVIAKASSIAGQRLAPGVETLAVLRRWKDSYKG